ncbi:hypothetical protein SLE2022_144200 [Rubroshorea leprosula]
MLLWKKQVSVVILMIFFLCLDRCLGHESCSSPVHRRNYHDHHHHHQCDHGHELSHHHRLEDRRKEDERKWMLLPEELAEEEDMRLFGFGPYHDHDHEHQQLSGVGLWLHALGCSLLVSLASLVCLIILPILYVQGKPSKAVVDSLALFGAGAMLGDAFLHQLPHAFGGEHSHSHEHHVDHSHFGHDNEHSHSHSFKDLSVGLSILAGVVLFLLVEKVVRYVEENSRGETTWDHGHHHHYHKKNKKLKDDNDVHDEFKSQPTGRTEGKQLDDLSNNLLNGDNLTQPESLQKRKTFCVSDDKSEIDAADSSPHNLKSLTEEVPAQSSSNLVFGYLNLFSDGVHNFTDGMALGSAFLLHGSVGGWSRTLFLLAHELPQEVGDFGILVRSGFSVTKALFFNFLSALVALAGTAMALLMGQDPGHSSLIEGFTAGGFIYIAVAGVLAEMNNSGSLTFKSITVQLISLTFGMAVALCISLVE